MTMGLYVIWDDAAKMGSKIWEATNDAIAWRNFEQANKGNDYADEAHLIKIGWVDKTDNILHPLDHKEIKPTDILHGEDE